MTGINYTYNLGKTKIFILLLTILLTNSFSFAQSEPEKAKPLHDMEIMRKVDILDIEGKYYVNVKVYLKSITPNFLTSDKYKVKVKVVNEKGKSLYKKTFKNVFLYVFRSGQILVGKNNFDKLIIFKSETTDEYYGSIRELEGVF